MTKDEALQMCLEYIETDAHERKYVRHAIKQALAAQQEHEPENEPYVSLASVQEPVAWGVFEGGNLHDMFFTKEEADNMAHLKGLHAEIRPLTTPPAAQRQWVGLTDEEVYPFANEHLHYQTEGYEVSGIYNLARAIEAKLKEKNT
jgi:hypothetical protein